MLLYQRALKIDIERNGIADASGFLVAKLKDQTVSLRNHRLERYPDSVFCLKNLNSSEYSHLLVGKEVTHKIALDRYSLIVDSQPTEELFEIDFEYLAGFKASNVRIVSNGWVSELVLHPKGCSHVNHPYIYFNKQQTEAALKSEEWSQGGMIDIEVLGRHQRLKQEMSEKCIPPELGTLFIREGNRIYCIRRFNQLLKDNYYKDDVRGYYYKEDHETLLKKLVLSKSVGLYVLPTGLLAFLPDYYTIEGDWYSYKSRKNILEVYKPFAKLLGNIPLLGSTYKLYEVSSN